jgi:hypothetical protein
MGGMAKDIGAEFIVGKPDIERLLGANWTPERRSAPLIQSSGHMN